MSSAEQAPFLRANVEQEEAWGYVDPEARWWNRSGFQMARERLSQDRCSERRCELPISSVARLQGRLFAPGAPAEYHQNLVAAIRSFKAGETVVSHKPLHWNVSAGYNCPNRCIHCYQVPRREAPYRLIPKAKAEMLSAMSVYACYWELTGGEPLVAPEDILDLLLPKYEHVNTRVFSSLNAPLAKLEFALPRISSILVSIDAATAATYEAIRRGARFSYLQEAMKLVVAAEVPATGVFVLMRSNLGDLASAPDVFHDMGITGFNLNRVMVAGREDTALNEDIYIGDIELDAEIRKSVDVARGRCAELGMTFSDGGVENYLSSRKV